MNYRQTLDYLYSQLPMFHRIGNAAYKANLENTIAICRLLGNPQNKFPSVHIAGTNGKGSSSHLLASVLQCAGYKVGLYTSPHLKDFRERIKINGKMISKKYISGFVEKYRNDFDKIKPSFFEWTVGLAFDYFAAKKVDIAIIETGLGGRLDSTNVITPLISLITNISYDHTNLLGDTFEKIAFEKAGIMKAGVPAVISETQKEIKSIFEKKSKKINSPLYFADKKYKLKSSPAVAKGKLFLKSTVRKNKKTYFKNLFCGLPGLYQQRNLPGVLNTIELLNEKGYKISPAHIAKGFSEVVNLTGLMGRWQLLGKNPFVIADIAHNDAGIRAVVTQLKSMKYNTLHIVFGVVNDKNTESILKNLPKNAWYYFCKAGIPRAKDALQLAAEAKLYNLNGAVYKSVKMAYKKALSNAIKKDFVLITGSTFVVAEVI